MLISFTHHTFYSITQNALSALSSAWKPLSFRKRLYTHIAASLVLSAPAINQQALAAHKENHNTKHHDVVSTPESIEVKRSANRPTRANGTLLTSASWKNVLTGSNPLALLSNTPGVSYTSSDSYGLDESDASLFMRGFHMNELGITFENIPLNDTGFGTLTGTTVLNIGVPDNIGSIYVSPGTSRESTFSSSNNGGELRYMLSNPTDTANAAIHQSYGSNQTFVTTATANTGQLGEHGPAILMGFQRISKDKYEGGGSQNMMRGNIKATQDLGWGNITAFFSASSAQIWGYNDQSFGMLKNLGWRADYMYPNYAAAYRMALPDNANANCGAYSCGEMANLVPYDSGQATRDLIGSIQHHFQATDALSGTVTFYGASSDTHASLADPTTPSLTGAPFSEQVWHPQIRRFGGTAELNYHIGQHTLSAGLWQEMASSSAGTSWYNEPALGQGAPLKTVGPYTLYGPTFQTANLSRWTTSSRQIFLHDDWHILPTLTLGFGMKAVNFMTYGGGIGDDDAPQGKLRARNWFLPHLSVFWHPDANNDVFLDAAETESGFRVSPRGNIGYSASPWTASDQSTYDTATQNIKPERDVTVTVGGHHREGRFVLSLDAYYSLIFDRLLSASVGTLHNPENTVGAVSRSHIVGGDASVSLPIGRFLTLSQSLSVSRFSYDADLNVEGTIFPIKGKAQPGYPGISLISGATFHYNRLQAGATSTVYLEQPFSYTNDVMGFNYWNTSAYISYETLRHGHIPALSFRFDVYNLLNRKMIGTLGVDGFPFSGDYQTMQRAAPRQALFTVGTRF
ncbi:TonB-dependent receptor [Neokomagataea thailandica]|uniref:TonB-dependent receptor n=1 Tax=Neokomagataea tanensis NBRC 106556 TaxID=1223519 RepID=A0ABQ0QIF1_9PROT|nr:MULTISPECIES: TonB-dependent receptor [Neokomagataea]GBR46000.1 TonB-dependent receptor [Neokomagataea tanensis NBRC 106556]